MAVESPSAEGAALSPRYLRVARTARYYVAGPEAGPVARLWVALHGHAMLAERFLAQLQPLADGDTLIIAPEALSRFYLETARDGRHANEVGASWLTREDREHEIADAVAYLDDLLREVSRPLTRGFQVGVLGFSQGGAIAARWVARGAALPERLVLWGLEPPGDALPGIAARLAGRELILVAGDADPLVPPGGIEAQARQLTEAGVLARAERFAGGHRVPPEALRRILGG